RRALCAFFGRREPLVFVSRRQAIPDCLSAEWKDRRISEGGRMPRLIEVIVSSTGEATVQTKGFSGQDCMQASRFLETALGVTGRNKKTAKYSQSASTEQQIRQ